MTYLPGTAKELEPQVLFHVYQILYATNGREEKSFRVDKDERVSFKPVTHPATEAQKITVVLKTPITMKNYFENLAPLGEKVWRYDPLEANCQYFAAWCLSVNGLLSQQLEQWIVQPNLRPLFSKESKSIMRGVTDVANLARGYFDING
jgi:hypothetical protein